MRIGITGISGSLGTALIDAFGKDHILVGITRDELAVRVDKTTGKARIYSEELFQQVINVNLLAPVYWALEMIGRIAEKRAAQGLKKWLPAEGMQGAIVFIGSISS